MGIPHTLIKIGGIALILALSIASGPRAAADDPPGNNGTVKIHDGDSEAEPIRQNEPHVGCTFHIHGFNFDASSSGTWSIQSWPPTGDRSVVAGGSWGEADGEGDWRTAVMSLPGGDHNQGAHYKLNVDQTSPSAPGAEKHKVFWVDCPSSSTTPESSPEVVVTPSPTPTEPSGTPNPGTGDVGTPVLGVETAPVGVGAPALGVNTAPISDPAVQTIRSLPSTSTN